MPSIINIDPRIREDDEVKGLVILNSSIGKLKILPAYGTVFLNFKF